MFKQDHTRYLHKCIYCGREIYGNGFWVHRDACKRKATEQPKKGRPLIEVLAVDAE